MIHNPCRSKDPQLDAGIYSTLGKELKKILTRSEMTFFRWKEPEDEFKKIHFPFNDKLFRDIDLVISTD